MGGTAFERYAPYIQEYIYRKQWTDLRQVQVEACTAILDTDKHVIIASGTATGKTEAAFFPILTLLEEHPPRSVAVLYIGPLKALINDQFARLQDLLRDRGIPVWPWHGDISSSVKKKALRTCRGIVQITPESLEALLMNHTGDARRLFSDLRFVVIDELHALLGADRGLQVMCLLERLERLTGCSPRRVGLSATLNDYLPAMALLAGGSGRETVAVGMESQKRTISLCVENYPVAAGEPAAAEDMQAYYRFLYDNSHLYKCLLFTNSRANAEKVIAELKEIARERHEPDVFFVHHGSVSAALRQEAEQALRERAGPTVTAATLTLELGIDIGDLDCTIQTGAPHSCASFVQRLGRSGRRTGKSRMMFVTLQEEADPSAFPGSVLAWDLIHSIAVIQLYLEERWVEPFVPKPKPFSLLFHQTLSTLVSAGELTPADLARSVLTLPPFRDTVTQDEYRTLLRHMLAQDTLERTEEGTLLVGLRAERLTRFFTFYAVFQEDDTYHVIAGEGEIGTLTTCPATDEVFVLAGRTWKVTGVDPSRRMVFVISAPSSKIPSWHGSLGDTHPRIVQRMRQVLAEDTLYPYLQPHARESLEKSRRLARQAGILTRAWIPGEGSGFYLFPWTGTKTLRTMAKLLSHGFRDTLEIQNVGESRHYLYVSSGLPAEEVMRRMQTLDADPEDPSLVLLPGQVPRVDKFDFALPDGLLRTAYLHNQTDVPGALALLREIGARSTAPVPSGPYPEPPAASHNHEKRKYP